jgi:eukaryotic-like serine/threonine-protein kinase
VVAPYDVLGGRPDDELAVWREGMVDVLSRSLDGLGPLRTVSPTTVVRRWRGRADPDAAEELARSTGAGVAVFGTLIAAGADSVRMRTTVLDTREHRVLDESEWRDVRARVDRLADSAAAAVVRHLAQTRPIGAVRLREAKWHVTPALRPFLQGEQYYRRAALDSARVAYERAVALDSTFALAHHRLRSVLRWLSHETDATALAHALRAGELNHGLGTRDSLLLVADSVRTALEGTPSYTPAWWALARRRAAAIDLAVARYPEDPEVRYEQGEVAYHYGGDLGVRDARALAAFEQAIALDSMFAPAYLHAIELSAALGHIARAQGYLEAYLRQSPHDAAVRLVARLMESAPTTPDSADAAVDATVDTLSRQAVFLAAYLTRRWADSAETATRLFRQLAAGRPLATGSEFDDPNRGRAFLVAILAYRGHVHDAFVTANGEFAEQNPPEFTQLALARLVSADTSDAVFGRWAREDDGVKVVLSLPWWAQRADTAMLASLSERLAAAPRRRLAQQELGMRTYGAHVARAYLALARHDSVSALRAMADAPDSLCGWRCVPDRLFRARILADRGRLREAVALLDRRPFPPPVTSVTELFWRIERARLAAAQGDDAQATREHALVSTLWRGGDPALRRYLAAAVNPTRDSLGADAP